jgi:hypothetical protein
MRAFFKVLCDFFSFDLFVYIAFSWWCLLVVYFSFEICDYYFVVQKQHTMNKEKGKENAKKETTVIQTS